MDLGSFSFIKKRTAVSLMTAVFFITGFFWTFPAGSALVSLEGEYTPPQETGGKEVLVSTGSLNDGKAEVDEVEGEAWVIKAGSPIERKIKEGDILTAGDSVYTEEGASLTISFDDEKLNVVKIPARNKAYFQSIEPTEIRLEDGSIFSSVDGLAEGSTWKVTTPAAVVAVRGTTFEVSYGAESGEFATATFEDAKTEKLSAVEIQAPGGGEAFKIIEGKEMTFARGQMPRADFVRGVSPERAQRGLQMREKVETHRVKHQQMREAKRKNQDHAAGPNPPQGPGGGPPDSPGLSPGDKPMPNKLNPSVPAAEKAIKKPGAAGSQDALNNTGDPPRPIPGLDESAAGKPEPRRDGMTDKRLHRPNEEMIRHGQPLSPQPGVQAVKKIQNLGPQAQPLAVKPAQTKPVRAPGKPVPARKR